jgi:hypothetical protein
VYLVLFRPYRGAPNAETFPAALKQLTDCSELLPTVPRWRESAALPKIALIDKDAVEQPIVLAATGPALWPSVYIRISTTEDIKARPVIGATREFTPEEELTFHKQAAWEDLGEFATDLLLALNIAMPGIFSVQSGYVFQDNVFCERLPTMQTNLEQSLEVSQQMNWPPIQWLPIPSVWAWLLQDDGFGHRFSSSPLGRALCAFSFLMGDRPWASANISDLIWSLVGLEALYERGNFDMTNQIVEKTQLFLGHQTDFKNDVKKMYHYRSRLLHGDLDFPSAYSRGSDDDFSNESSRASSIAAAILVSTLQRMALENLRELRFHYVMELAPKPAPAAE